MNDSISEKGRTQLMSIASKINARDEILTADERAKMLKVSRLTIPSEEGHHPVLPCRSGRAL